MTRREFIETAGKALALGTGVHATASGLGDLISFETREGCIAPFNTEGKIEEKCVAESVTNFGPVGELISEKPLITNGILSGVKVIGGSKIIVDKVTDIMDSFRIL